MCYETYYNKLNTILQNRAEELAFTPQCQVSYPEPVRQIWTKLNGIPGERYLFGSMLIDLLRSRKFGLPVFNFLSSCKHAGEVFDAQNEFETSVHSSRQCRLTASNHAVINLFLMGEMGKEDNTAPLFFTIDLVMSDEQGNICDLGATGLRDIKDGILRMHNPAASPLKEKPAAVLYAMLRMSQGFTPDDDLKHALFDWLPSGQMNMVYLKEAVSENLKQLSPEERLQYVNLCRQYDLFKKMFGVDYSTLTDADALRELEALITKAKLGHTPFLFSPAAVSSSSPSTVPNREKFVI